MKTVMIFGTFDCVHEGHRSLFQQAKAHGDHLVCVVARDETVVSVKGRRPINDEESRIACLLKEPLIDVVSMGHTKNKYRVLHEYKPDVICLGYDQVASTDKLEEALHVYALPKTIIVRLDAYHPETYKSSLMNKSSLMKSLTA